MVTAKRALDQGAGILGLEIVLRRKPSFKAVLLLALEIENFHDSIMSKT
jgi:hypothetical protein